MSDPAPDSPAFTSWVASVRGLTLVAVAASLLGTVMVAGALATAHSFVVGEGAAPELTLGPLSIELPDNTATTLVAAGVALTLASVVQTLLRRFDAVIVRRRLGAVTRGTGPARPTARQLMAERHLLESWLHTVSSSVQALGYTAAMAWVGGATEFAGMIIAVFSTVTVAVSYSRRATVASLHFLATQRRANAIHRAQRRDPEAVTSDEIDQAMGALSDGVYRRDNEAFRIPVGKLTFLSVVLIAAAVVPAVLTLPAASLPFFLLLLFIWRQRMIDAVQGIGPLAWSIELWRNASLMDPSADAVEFDDDSD